MECIIEVITLVNFKKLKSLINVYERRRETEQKEFYERLYNIAKEEISLKQVSLFEFNWGD